MNRHWLPLTIPVLLLMVGLIVSCGPSRNSNSAPGDAQSSSEDGARISQEGFAKRGLDWPFTVSEGFVGCDREALWFKADRESYALNGWAVSLFGYAQPYEIWRYQEYPNGQELHPQAARSRMNISDVQNEARKLCKGR